MYEVLDKDTIKTEHLPHLSVENVVVTQKKRPVGRHSKDALQVANCLSKSD